MSDQSNFSAAELGLTPQAVAFAVGLEAGTAKIVDDINTYAAMIEVAGNVHGMVGLGLAALEDIHQVLGEQIAQSRAELDESVENSPDPTKENQP